MHCLQQWRSQGGDGSNWLAPFWASKVTKTYISNCKYCINFISMAKILFVWYHGNLSNVKVKSVKNSIKLQF
jgi:hypothetical protein